MSKKRRIGKQNTETKSPHRQDTRDTFEQRYGELEKRLTGGREVAAHEEAKILEQQHTTTAATINDAAEILERHTMTTAEAAQEESQILERKHTTTAATEDEEETLEQHTMETAAATNDESEILEQQQVTTERAAAKYVADILEQKHAATMVAITNGETETLEQRGRNDRQPRPRALSPHRKTLAIFEDFKGIRPIASMQDKKRESSHHAHEKQLGTSKQRGKALPTYSRNSTKIYSQHKNDERKDKQSSEAGPENTCDHSDDVIEDDEQDRPRPRIHQKKTDGCNRQSQKNGKSANSKGIKADGI